MNRPLDFCMITTFYPPYSFGGDGVFVHRLSNELARRGHRVDVIHCIDAYRLLARKEPQEGYADHPNVTVHGLRSPFGFLSPLATQLTGFPLFKSRRIRQILAMGFDVIHYHNISLIGGPKILEFGQGIKLYTMHEYWLICPTHVLFKYNHMPCTRPNCLLCSLLYRRPPQLWRYTGLLTAMARHVHAFIAPSQFSHDVHRKMGLKAPIVNLPYFISERDAALSSLDEADIEAKAPYFLFVGRLEKLKGLQTLIPVFRRYQKAQLWIAGRGTLEPQLRQLAQGCDNIRFLGYVPYRRLRSLYKHARALIVPSICFDVVPLVSIEACKEATPIIVRNRGGMSEIVQQSKAGFVYETEAELLAAMDQLITDPSLRDELGQRGYRAYQQNWTAEAHLQQYLGLIDEIAAKLGRSLGRDSESDSTRRGHNDQRGPGTHGRENQAALDL